MMAARVAAIEKVKKAARSFGVRRTSKLARTVPDAPIGTADAPVAGRIVVRLDREGTELLEGMLPYRSAAPLAGRLEKGDRCWAVVAGPAQDVRTAGAIEAFVWTASGRTVYVDELGAEVWVPRRTAYVHELFTFPGSRGRGHAKALLRTVVSDLARERSFGAAPEHLEAWVDERNEPSVRAFVGLGFAPYDAGWRLASFGPLRFLDGCVGFLEESFGVREDAPVERRIA